MVKSTVRFPESMAEEIEALVEEGVVESKSEFQRFSADYVLSQTVPDYEPETLDFEELKDELLASETIPEESGISFLESVLFIRKHAHRGNITDAEDFIDHHYDPADRDAVLLEEILSFYRQTTNQPSPTPRTSKSPSSR